MTRIAYIDAIAGVAGDMLLGALLDAGADLEQVREGIARLGIAGLTVRTEPAERHGIVAQRVVVEVPHGDHAHRSWADVRAILDRATLPARAAARAHAVFAALARAEGTIHGVDPDTVHFHEVGGHDAIADVCGIALALELLDVDEVACSPLPTPRGFVKAAHGTLPLPAPATAELLRGALLVGTDLEVELVTPTGAAVVAALAVEHGAVPPMRLEAVGYGAGTRDLEQRPNVVRVLIGERTLADVQAPTVKLLETNLDDLPPQLVPEALERALVAGALDAWVTPVQMKKGRPGLVLSVLARPADEAALAAVLLRETTTLGVRVSTATRRELDREWIAVDVDGESVRVKVGRLDGGVVNVWPEYEDCLRVARGTDRPVKAIWTAALAAGEHAVREAGQ